SSARCARSRSTTCAVRSPRRSGSSPARSRRHAAPSGEGREDESHNVLAAPPPGADHDALQPDARGGRLGRRVRAALRPLGARSAGIRLLEEIESRRRLRLAVIGFVDDDVAKVGLRVCGTPVLGCIEELPALVAEHEVGEVLIAIPSASPALLRRIVQHCTAARVRHRVLPTLSELVEGSVIYTQMREVKVDDLLARDPIRLDVARVHSLVTGKTVLVTGAAGSIGSELCRQLAAQEPERLILYDRHENGVFVLEMEL